MQIKDAVNVSFFSNMVVKKQNKPYNSLEIYWHTNGGKKTVFKAFLKHIVSTGLNDFQISCKENYEHLQKLNLRESGEGERNADVLMGSDYYWMFFSRKLIKGSVHVTFLNWPWILDWQQNNCYSLDQRLCYFNFCKIES